MTGHDTQRCPNPRCKGGWVDRGDNESGGAPAFPCRTEGCPYAVADGAGHDNTPGERNGFYTADQCNGSYYCTADHHVHGCFADKGACDEPAEHTGRSAASEEGNSRWLTVLLERQRRTSPARGSSRWGL